MTGSGTGASERRVEIEIAEHVAIVTLSRPEHNALDLPMFEAIIAAAQRLREEPSVRAVVLHGAGPSFCSGLDIASLMSAAPGGEAITARLQEPPPNFFQRVSIDWTALAVPVIAALHGACYGGGLQIALGADIRIATPDARLSVMEVKWGLVPDMGISRTLSRLARVDVAKELTFTRLDDDPLAAARGLAAEIAGRSPDAVRAAKRLFEESWVSPTADQLALEAALQRRLIGSPNQLAAVMAGMTGAPPEFTDPS
jgi:enoyl-CoA hydratase/carnithine racemase